MAEYYPIDFAGIPGLTPVVLAGSYKKLSDNSVVTPVPEIQAIDANFGFFKLVKPENMTEPMSLIIDGGASIIDLTLRYKKGFISPNDFVNGTNVIQIAGTAQTARDIGASVLISSGTGMGQLDVTGGVVKSASNINFTDGSLDMRINSLTVDDENNVLNSLNAAMTQDGDTGDYSIDSNLVSMYGMKTVVNNLMYSLLSIRVATINGTNFSPTNSQFETSDITDPSASHWKDRSIIFIDGVLRGQAKTILNYSLVSGDGHFVTEAFTSEPADGDKFLIV